MADRYDYDPEAFDYAMPRTSTDPKQAGEFVRGAKYAPFDLLGAPVDIANLLMGGAGGTKPFLGSEYLIDKYADLGEALGIEYERPTYSTAETAGRLTAGFVLDPALAGGIGLKLAQQTKTRGAGIEKKGSGAAQLDHPISTVKAYKMFRKDKDGNLHPLFVKMGDKQPLPIGQWIKAEAGELNPKTGKVKSSLGDLAYRPGFHAGDTPSATHIGGKVDPVTGARVKGSMKPNIREENQVWAEVEMPADVDWQSIADARAVMTKKGTPDPKTAHITDEVPYGGYYRYKTNPNMQGNWLISGQMKINRVLDDDEVKAVNEAAGTSDLPRMAELLAQGEARTSDLPTAPKKEVLEGEVVGSKSKKYMDLQKKMDEASSPDLRAARELNMETQGVKDAFDLNAARNIDKNFEFASGGDEVRSTADEFIDGVIDEFQGARDQGFSRGEALIDAVRVKVKDYNDIYPDALDVNSVLDDIAKNVNEDFGFDDALSRFREAQTNQKSLQDQAQTAKYQRIAEEQAAARRVQEEQLGIADLSDADKAAFYRNMAQQDQSGIAGAGIPDPQPPKPNLRLVKKAAGGPVDLRSGIGNVFKLYS